MPWRRTNDPYAILVSELMLQQTGVETAIRYYEPFLLRFPTARALARAETEEVLKSWEGLGYYARAKNLRRTCQIIVERYGGRIPEDYAALLKLPGIGAYSAGALLSIIYERPFPSVDGNVHRVFSRAYALDDVANARDEKRRTHNLARDYIQIAFQGGLSPSDFNQAYIELGALVCSPKKPLCDKCPIAGDCVALQAGLQRVRPLKEKSRALETKEMEVGIIWSNQRLMLERRDETGLLKGFWGLPTTEAFLGAEPGQSLVRYLATRYDLETIYPRELFVEQHVFTHQRWRMRVFHAFCELSCSDEHDPERSFAFFDSREIEALAIPKAFRKVLARYAERPLHVVAAIIKDETGRVFTAKRKPGGYFGDYWEFPGGKVEPGETEEAALKREIQEELSIVVEPTRFLQRNGYSYPFGQLQISFYECERKGGTIRLTEHREGRWLKPEQMKPQEFPPADAMILEALQRAPGR